MTPQKSSRLFLCLTALYAVCLVTAGCATRSYDKLDHSVLSAQYREALVLLEKEKKSIYGKDAVLYYLDKGMVAHYAGDYKDSSDLLQRGERAIEDAFTKSVTKNIASFIANDNTKEYAGEDYEDIYINVFNALNYYHINKLEDAMVEIRRLEGKLRVLSDKYNLIERELEKEDGSAAQSANVKVRFNNSALARYLSILFYRSRGQFDDARIDRDWLKRSFQDAKAIYPHPVPSSIDDELNVPSGKARLNVISFAGLSPVKVQETVRVPLLPSNNWIKIALPAMTARPSEVASIDVLVDGKTTFKLELIENIQTVVNETFKKHLGIIKAKSIIRATVKGGTAAGFSSVGEKEENAALSLIGIGLQLFAEISERADIRIARYFPARAFVGGITLEPGKYTLAVRYYNKQGGVVASFPYKEITVAAGDLNLLETVFLR